MHVQTLILRKQACSVIKNFLLHHLIKHVLLMNVWKKELININY